MKKFFPGLPEGLEEALKPIPDNKSIMRRLNKISDNSGIQVAGRKVAGSAEDIIYGWKAELEAAGWTPDEIAGESKNPADLSLIQVLRPGSTIDEVTNEYVIIIMPTGAKIKHGRLPKRIAISDTVTQPKDS